jgi:hypothetical protein
MRHIKITRNPLHVLLVLVLVACGAAAAQTSPASVFDYDAKAPLDVQVVSTQKEGTLTLQEITYASPKGGRVPATLIVPDGKGPFAGILLMHGAPGTRDRMLPEARELAQRGAVTIAINAPFSRPGRAPEDMIRFDERDRDDQIQLIVDLRRAVDVLLARKDVDPARLAYTGRSYGGAMGGLLAGVEKRIKAYALVVGDGGLVAHFTGIDDRGRSPLEQMPREERQRWLAAMQPIEPVRFVGKAAPSHLLFQNGMQDQLVPPVDGRAYQEAGSEPKTLLWYQAGHQLNDEAVRDRHLWFAEMIGIEKPAPAPQPAQ